MSVKYPDRDGQRRAANEMLPRVRRSLKRALARLAIERGRWKRARRRGDRAAMGRTQVRGRMYKSFVTDDERMIAALKRML